MDLAAYLNPETLQKLQTGGYVLMLGLMILEWPIVTFIASFLASIWFFDFFIVLMLGWAGDILGDVLYFSLGRFGIQFFTKTHKKGPENNSDFLSKLDSLIHSNLFLSIFVVKFTPYIQPLWLTFIWKSDISFRRYMLYSTLLCIPIPLAFGMTWYYLGQLNNILRTYP
jgi:membrane protein DedA with SNARE-associated domain